MRCSRVRPRSVATRRRSTTPRSRSLTACGVAPKLEFLSRLRTSGRPGPAPRREPGSHSPLPTPVGHAGLRSTSSSLPQAVSSNAAPSSKATHTTRRKHGKQKSCRTPSFYAANRNADVTYPQRAPKNGAQKHASVKPLWRAFPLATCTGLLMLWQLVSLGIQPREWADLLDLSPFDQCSVGALQPPGPVLVVESPPYSTLHPSGYPRHGTSATLYAEVFSHQTDPFTPLVMPAPSAAGKSRHRRSGTAGGGPASKLCVWPKCEWALGWGYPARTHQPTPAPLGRPAGSHPARLPRDKYATFG